VTTTAFLRCQCGHRGSDHRPKCTNYADDDDLTNWKPCGCEGFVDRVTRLPEGGERLEFGKHRIGVVEADSAPAWDPNAVKKWADKRLKGSA
jgi:hypothetical protein